MAEAYSATDMASVAVGTSICATCDLVRSRAAAGMNHGDFGACRRDCIAIAHHVQQGF
jgi:hypothetical protein